MTPASRAPGRAQLAATVLLVLHAFAYVLWTEDDVGISLRYAANLASGDGLTYNPGERVEAISNLGLVLTLAPLSALLTGTQAKAWLLLAAKLIGLAAAVATLAEARRLAATLGLSPRATSATLLLAAGCTPFAAWAVVGLEVPLVTWAATVLLTRTARLARSDETRPPRAVWQAAAAGVALVLLRTDGFVLPLACAGLLLLAGVGPRQLMRVAAPPVVAFAALIAARLSYYGAPLPLPVLAKVDLATSLAATSDTLTIYFIPFLRLLGGWPVALVAIATTALATGDDGRSRRIAAGFVLALFAYSMLVGRDWMPLYRFLVPAVIPLIALIVAMAATIGRRLSAHLGREPAPAVVAAVVLGLAAASALAGHASFRTRRAAPIWYLHPTFAVADLVSFWQPAVDWLAHNTDRGATLVTSEAGFIPYLSGLTTVESYGLATPAIAHLPRGQVERSTLGVLTAFTEGPPADPAQRLLAGTDAAALVLQVHMVRLWNDGRVPDSLFGGRFLLSPDSPVGERWAVYVPAMRSR